MLLKQEKNMLVTALMMGNYVTSLKHQHSNQVGGLQSKKDQTTQINISLVQPISIEIQHSRLFTDECAYNHACTFTIREIQSSGRNFAFHWDRLHGKRFTRGGTRNVHTTSRCECTGKNVEQKNPN